MKRSGMLILRTLESTGQNKTRAAEILGVSLKTLHNKLKEYSQSREDPAGVRYSRGDLKVHRRGAARLKSSLSERRCD